MAARSKVGNKPERTYKSLLFEELLDHREAIRKARWS